jgi:hypothetical protein
MPWMQTSRLHWEQGSGWTGLDAGMTGAGLVLYFGSREVLAPGGAYEELRSHFPAAHLLGCSAGGLIAGPEVNDAIVTAVALRFEHTALRVAKTPITDSSQSRDCGVSIGTALAGDGLAGIFLLSDGLRVNGSALVDGVISVVGRGVQLSGGLAGDDAEFAETLVGCNDQPIPGQVAAVGLYGDAIRIGNGCAGGWDVFGPVRKITRSEGNVLLEVDDRPALDLYKLYLGSESEHLPGSALLFPIRISNPRAPALGLVRTILGVDHDTGSMTFAGDMPEGWSAQLMRGSIARLCEGAAVATSKAVEGAGLGATEHSVAILVSCIGRRLLMGQRIDEELEAALPMLGEHCAPVGFYSFGEISPDEASGFSRLHNQTMTVTVLGERLGQAA